MSPSQRPAAKRSRRAKLGPLNVATEKALRESEELLRSTLNNAPLVVFSIDVEGRFLVSEGRALAALGLRPGQVVGQSVYDLYGDQPQILDCYKRALAGEEFSALNLVAPLNVTYETVWRPLRNGHGKILGVAGVATDITERMRAETALRDSEERLRLALGAAQMGVWEWDAATNNSTWDDNLCRMMGVEAGAFRGNPAELAGLIHPDDRAKFVEAKKRSAETGEFYLQEFRVIRPDGRMVWIIDQGQAERDASGRVVRFRGVARDVSQQRDLQEQLHRAQKMEALGQLAVGIAHDFNNILTIIKGHLDLLAGRLQPNAAEQRDVKIIGQATDRAAGITRQLLAFGRKSVLRLRELDLRAVVSEIANLLYPLIGPKIGLQLELGDEQLWVKADDTQIEQVVVNLVINARDASAEGGTIVLKTDRRQTDASMSKLYPRMPEGRYVRITIRDNGSGMDAQTVARIFEPFFTTKAQGKGTGLGLASVYGIVKQSGGWIWVNSEVGVGTTFEVFFPEVAPPEIHGPGKKHTPGKAA
ncbi:MAG TPA: PAS domain S-box protein [Candidatus Bathyarchaeia archaeon]|nr:PAS domain S-box protein [Candidatus Bathyarchaeia archaeon]